MTAEEFDDLCVTIIYLIDKKLALVYDCDRANCIINEIIPNTSPISEEKIETRIEEINSQIVKACNAFGLSLIKEEKS